MILQMNGDAAETSTTTSSGPSIAADLDAQLAQQLHLEEDGQVGSSAAGAAGDGAFRSNNVTGNVSNLAQGISSDVALPPPISSAPVSRVAAAGADFGGGSIGSTSRSRASGGGHNNRGAPELHRSETARSNPPAIGAAAGCRGKPVALPPSFLRLPPRLQARHEEMRASSSSSSMGGASRAFGASSDSADAQVAMAAYEELLAQQLAEEMEQEASLGNLVSNGLASLGFNSNSSSNNSSSSSSSSRNNSRGAASSSAQQNHQTTSQPPNRSNNSASTSSDSSSSGFSMARASAFFASAQEEAKRKMNEVAVQFQAVTGNGGYATQVLSYSR